MVDAVFKYIGSGLNYNCKKWNQLLEEALRQKGSRILLAHKDRLVRFGFEWLERFLKTHGVELVLVPNEKRRLNRIEYRTSFQLSMYVHAEWIDGGSIKKGKGRSRC